MDFIANFWWILWIILLIGNALLVVYYRLIGHDNSGTIKVDFLDRPQKPHSFPSGCLEITLLVQLICTVFGIALLQYLKYMK